MTGKTHVQKTKTVHLTLFKDKDILDCIELLKELNPTLK